MSGRLRFENAVKTLLAASITDTDTEISVTAGDGAKFPALSEGDHFFLTLVEGQFPNEILEVIHVTAVSGDTLTVERGQDGTTARAYNVGAGIEMRVNAGIMRHLIDERQALEARTIASDEDLAAQIASVGGDAGGSTSQLVSSAIHTLLADEIHAIASGGAHIFNHVSDPHKMRSVFVEKEVLGAVESVSVAQSVSTQGETILDNNIPMLATTSVTQTALVANGAETALSFDGGATWGAFSADHGTVAVPEGSATMKVKVNLEAGEDFSSITFDKQTVSSWLLDNENHWDVEMTSATTTTVANVSTEDKNARIRIGATGLMKYDYTKTIPAESSEMITLPVDRGGDALVHLKQFVLGNSVDVSDTQWDFDVTDGALWDGGTLSGDGAITLGDADAVTVTSLAPVNTTIAESINSITATDAKPTGTDARYAISFDGKTTWRTNGNAVVTLAELSASGMTAAELAAFDFSGVTLGATLDVAIALSTTDNTVTPSVDQITVDMTTTGSWSHVSPDLDGFVVTEIGTNQISVTNSGTEEATLKIGVGIGGTAVASSSGGSGAELPANATQAEMEAGSETAIRMMSPANVKSAVTGSTVTTGNAIAMAMIFG